MADVELVEYFFLGHKGIILLMIVCASVEYSVFLFTHEPWFGIDTICCSTDILISLTKIAVLSITTSVCTYKIFLQVYFKETIQAIQYHTFSNQFFGTGGTSSSSKRSASRFPVKMSILSTV